MTGTNWPQLWFDFIRQLFRQFGVLKRQVHSPRGRYLVVGLPLLFLGLFFLVPLLIVLKISFATADMTQPPYTELLTRPDENTLTLTLNLANYRMLWEDPLYWSAFVSSLEIAGISTLLTLLIGYPLAYAIARAAHELRLILLLLVVLPFWTSSLLRTYAWMGLLKDTGPLNQLMLALGLVDAPLAILNTNLAVYIGIVYNYLPFMVLPLVANLVRLDPTLLEAAADLGAKPWVAFFRVTVPLSMPGIIAGSMLVFIPALGEFVIPDLLGGPDSLMIGRLLWTEFFSNTDWPLASAVAIAMLALIVLPLVLFEYVQTRELGRKEDAR